MVNFTTKTKIVTRVKRGVARTKEGVMEAVMNLIIVGLIVISLSLMG